MNTFEIIRDNFGPESPTSPIPMYDADGAFNAWMTGKGGSIVPITGTRGLVTLCYRGVLPSDAWVRARVGPIEGYDVWVTVPYRETDIPGVFDWGLFLRADVP